MKEENFWSKVDKCAAGGCWEWMGYINRDGYGRFGKGTAHRASWIINNGGIPKGEGHHGMCVLHTCDNPKCVNPRHLFLGTMGDNMRDKGCKGRAPHGTDHDRAKMTPEIVRAVRRRYVPRKVSAQMLADEYGVGQQAIDKVLRGITWRHVR